MSFRLVQNYGRAALPVQVAALRTATFRMTKNDQEKAPALPPYIFPVRLHLTPDQQQSFTSWWQVARSLDLLTWLTVQSVLQLETLPTPDALCTACAEGRLLPGLLYPDPDSLHLNPAALLRIQKEERRPPCHAELKDVEELVRKAVPSEQLVVLPYGVVTGAIRRIYGSMMHVSGHPDEVRMGDIPHVRTLADAPAITFTSVQPTSDHELLIRSENGSAHVVGAELFTLPRAWREEVLRRATGPGCAPITKGVAEFVDGHWRLFLKLSSSLETPRAHPPRQGAVGIDPGMIRWIAARDRWEDVPFPQVSRKLPLKGNDLMARREGFQRLEPTIDEAYRILSDYAVVCWEGSPAPSATEPDKFHLYQERSFQRVLLDRLAADRWPSGPRRVVRTYRTGTSRRCPKCQQRLKRNWREGREVKCTACFMRGDRDSVAAENHLRQIQVRSFPTVLQDLPGDLPVDLRRWWKRPGREIAGVEEMELPMRWPHGQAD